MSWFLKYAFSHLIRFILLPLYLLPLNKNRILFISYGGMQYSCNPKYISEFIQENYKNKYEIIWVFKEPENFSFLSDSLIKVKYLSFKHFYYVITSGVCITNMGFNKFFFVRKKQRFVQTWHGGGAYKRSGKSITNNFFQKLLNDQHDNIITDFISSSEYFSKYFISDLSYHHDILNIGMPRNSFLLKNAKNNQLKNFLKRKIDKDYSENKIYILYAPTWRDDRSNYELPDFTTIIDILKEKEKKEVVILFRSHHFHNINISNLKKYCIDVTNYSDMQELLLISDILISDYSSSIWDFSLLYKPCFLYVPDLSKYEGVRGFYTNIYDWGFDVCIDKIKLENSIANFNKATYTESIKNMHERFGSFENNNSCEKLMNILSLR